MRPSSLSPPSDRQRRSFSIRSSRDKEDLERALAGIQQPPPPVESAPPVEETKEGEEEPQRPASRRVSARVLELQRSEIFISECLFFKSCNRIDIH